MRAQVRAAISLLLTLLSLSSIVLVNAGQQADQMPDDEPLKQFLLQLEAKCAAIADLECELRETFLSDGKPERTSRFRRFATCRVPAVLSWATNS
ncbi:MAG TPA: hypothetical protein PKO06_15170 [Candidatus Ozemobacteraceae bacterium]|nr:hypothetical protein [Candidatus Ozemobacteraceae bacterium]